MKYRRLAPAFAMGLALACSKPGNDAPPPAASSPLPEGSAAALRDRAASGSGGAARAPEDEEGQFGSRVDAKEFDAAIGALPPSAFGATAAPPRRVVLENLPAVAAQGTAKHRGSPGSCEAQSFGYGLGTYTAARAPDGHVLWDAAQPANAVSAAFLYAYQHKLRGVACPKGSGALEYLSRLVQIGSPSAAEVPYQPDCGYLDGASFLDERYSDEARLRIGSFATFHLSRAALPLVKALLADGHAIAFSGPVLKGYGNPKLEDGVFTGTETVPGSGHGQLIVGYDDGKGKDGALLVQNSFGEDWPPAAPGGRIWQAYETLLGTQKLAAIAYPRDPSPPAGARLAAKGNAPAASIERAFQWAAEKGGGEYIVLMHHFAEPVLLASIALQEPRGGKTVVAKLEQWMQSGYTYLRRGDGKSFSAGDWTVTLEGKTVSGESATYTGKVALAAGRAPAAPIAMPVFGPTGAETTLR